MVASSLEEFLAVWALAGFDSAGDLVASGHRVSLPFDLLYQADSGAPDGRADFLDFLRQRLGREPQAIVGPHPPHQPIERFFEEWSETQRQKMATDSTLRSIAGILDAYIPRGKQPWDRVSLDIRVAGARSMRRKVQRHPSPKNGRSFRWCSRRGRQEFMPCVGSGIPRPFA